MALTEEVQALDRPWGAPRIELLLFGDTRLADGTSTEALTAFEQRVLAYDHGKVDLIHEPAQMDMLIATVRDHGVRAALMLRTKLNASEEQIDRLLTHERRPAHQLLNRGAELVRRQVNGERTKARLDRKRKAIREARCVTCSKLPLGEFCPECGFGGKTWKSGAAPYDPLNAPDPSKMTDAEREAEIAKLAAGQIENPEDYRWNDNIPGGRQYRRKVTPVGQIKDGWE
jgi:hypothetical protein